MTKNLDARLADLLCLKSSIELVRLTLAMPTAADAHAERTASEALAEALGLPHLYFNRKEQQDYISNEFVIMKNAAPATDVVPMEV